ncbi:hypothetical protein BT96DRAFT_1002630 [Gymnopus androsaceus JB14]|uniref:Uncharacterized protein n=1 Tax=Gymnopus androsaceus JB14 TaxID=1447944 RepID=A0A6A4GX97_9AGAR|nr:hypothetical protein BT96DRAFT_1002630 [Gymnopus androsaceus JB14]
MSNPSNSRNPSFNPPPNGDYKQHSSDPGLSRQQTQSAPAYPQRQSAPAAAPSGAFFAGSHSFNIHGGLFQDNKGNAETRIVYDNSYQTGFGNQYGDSYLDSDKHATNFHGPYVDRQSFHSYNATANWNAYPNDTRGRGYGRGYGRGRNRGFMMAHNPDMRYHSSPAGIPQAQQQRSPGYSNEDSGHRPAITEHAPYNPGRFNQRFDEHYQHELEESQLEEDDQYNYPQDQYYEEMQLPDDTYQEAHNQQQPWYEQQPWRAQQQSDYPEPVRSAGPKKNNPFRMEPKPQS